MDLQRQSGARRCPGCIRLTGLSATGYHGVFPHEREAGQTFVADVELRLPIEIVSDQLRDTVDYSALADRIIGVIVGEPVDLIETLAGRIGEVCLADDRIESVAVTVHKPLAPLPYDFTDVSVTLELHR